MTVSDHPAGSPDPVPCKNATDYEIGRGKHLTTNGNRVCSVCRHTLDRFLSALWLPDEDDTTSDPDETTL